MAAEYGSGTFREGKYVLDKLNESGELSYDTMPKGGGADAETFGKKTETGTGTVATSTDWPAVSSTARHSAGTG